MKNKSTARLVMILAPFVFSFAFGLDIYIPIAPEIKEILHTNQILVQLTLSLFLMGNGVGQLIAGPCSDRFGRHKVMLSASALFTLGSLICALTPNIVILLIGRVICAFGAAGMIAIAFAIIRDLFSGDRGAQMYSYLNGAIGISPVFAPIIGGYLAVWLGWRAVFWFLVGLGLISMLVTLLQIRETLPVNKRISLDAKVMKRYVYIFTHPDFIPYGILAGLGIGICFSFFSISPFIIINLLHISVEHFGYCFAVFGTVIAGGGVLAGYLISRFNIKMTIIIGIGLTLLGGISMLLWDWLWGLNLWGFLLPTVFATAGGIFVAGASAGAAMEPFPEMAGTASASFGCSEFVIASVIGTVLMHWPVVSTVSFAICILLVGVGMLLTLTLIAKHS